VKSVRLSIITSLAVAERLHDVSRHWIFC